jgi:hypothetical protein
MEEEEEEEDEELLENPENGNGLETPQVGPCLDLKLYNRGRKFHKCYVTRTCTIGAYNV